jgi:hypothetical protein
MLEGNLPQTNRAVSLSSGSPPDAGRINILLLNSRPFAACPTKHVPSRVGGSMLAKSDPFAVTDRSALSIAKLKEQKINLDLLLYGR